MNPEKIKSPEKLTLKKLLPEDWGKFKEIRLKGLQTDPQSFGGMFETESKKDDLYWQERLSDPERCTYVAEEGSVFVATAGSKKIDKNNWMIGAVYTVPEFRGKNISTQLIELITEEAKMNGVSKVSLYVNSHQEAVVGLYKKLGFEIIKTEKDQKLGDGKLYDCYYMEKVLNPHTSA